MPDLTWDHVINTAIDQKEELEAFTQAQIDLVLNETFLRVVEAKYKQYLFDAQRYFAAHVAIQMITDPAGEGTTGSESIGAISVSKTLAVNNPSAKENLLTTIYGRQFFEITQSICPRFHFGG